jgi:hypothetical protein
MARSKLIAGLFVPQDGFYRVSHASGHMPDAECFLPKGMLLPSCLKDGCNVLYTFLRDGSFLPDEKPKDSYLNTPSGVHVSSFADGSAGRR